MKLVVDGRYTKMEYHDGISRYGAGLIAALHELTQKTPEIQLQILIHDERQKKMLPEGAHYVVINRPDSFLELFISRKLNALDADVVFSPMQIIGGIRRSKRNYALIVTLHDLIYYDHPDPPPSLPRWQKIFWRWYHKSYAPQRLLLNRADRVATISHTTKQLMLQRHLTRRPIDIIENAPTLEPDALKLPCCAAARQKSLVYMGSFIPYKNVAVLIDVANALPDYTLHLLSRIGTSERIALTQHSRQGNVVFHNGVSDNEYYRLITDATALVSLSLAEGYGLPVIESMALGTPVVVSDIPIFHEIAADAALYVSPRNVADAVAAIKFLEDNRSWNKLSALSIRQARSFSWEKSARKLLKVAQELTTPTHEDPQ